MTYRITGRALRQYQRDIVSDIVNGKHKHLLLIAPRRAGKSVLILYMVNALINKYWVDTKMPVNATVFAPQAKQCRSIYVDNILQDGRKLLELSNGKFVESRLSLEYSFGSKVKFSGSDMIDNHMGAGNKIVVLDEYALSKPETFQRLYPMVQATNGHMIVTSTPRGRNHMFDLFQQVKDNPDWLVIHTDVFQLGLMTQDEYDTLPMHINYKRQEFLCSWDSPFENAIYTDCNIYHGNIDYSKPIYVALDLGIRDATAFIVAQIDGNDIRIVHSMEVTNVSLSTSINTFKAWVAQHDLQIEKMYVPHDTNQRDLITGRSRMDYMREQFDTAVTLVRKSGLMDGIEIVRNKWHHIYWAQHVKAIESIKAYITDQASQLPKHDNASHMADALRYLIVGLDYDMKDYHQVKASQPQYYRTMGFSRKI